MPWESWPARLALTQPVATASASACDAPAALRSAAPMRVRRSAFTIGMAFPHSNVPHGGCGSCLFWLRHGLKEISRTQRDLRAKPPCDVMGAMQSGEASAAARFHLPAGPTFALFILGHRCRCPRTLAHDQENGVLVLGTVPMHLLAVMGH